MEATEAAMSKKDPSSLNYSLNDIKKFSYEQKYDELCNSHPLLMHVLVASMTNNSVESIEVTFICLHWSLFTYILESIKDRIWWLKDRRPICGP